MPIKQLTPSSAIAAHLEEQIKRIEKATVYMLCSVGESCINEARHNKRYLDQTGNLKSSVGYVVSIDGQIVRMSDFTKEKNGSVGQSDGRAYAKKLVHQYPRGIVLIVVAGMQYASYVEAKGLNVLESSELRAKSLVPQVLKQLGFR